MDRHDISLKLIKHREELGLTIWQMAKRLGLTERLIEILENDGETMPLIIAKRIMPEYGLSREEGELLLPINMRPHGSDYEPNRYFTEDGEFWLWANRYYGKEEGDKPAWILDPYDIRKAIEENFGEPDMTAKMEG